LSCLPLLPDELWLMILRNLRTSDFIEAHHVA
jgi:hypothetical protein